MLEKFEGDGSEIIVEEAVRFITDELERGKPFLSLFGIQLPMVPGKRLKKILSHFGKSGSDSCACPWRNCSYR